MISIAWWSLSSLNAASVLLDVALPFDRANRGISDKRSQARRKRNWSHGKSPKESGIGDKMVVLQRADNAIHTLYLPNVVEGL